MNRYLLSLVVSAFVLSFGCSISGGQGEEQYSKEIRRALRTFENGDEEERTEAAKALGRLGPVAVPAVFPLLDSRSAQLRECAVSTIGEVGRHYRLIGQQPDYPELRRVLKAIRSRHNDPSPIVREQAAFALGMHGEVALADVVTAMAAPGEESRAFAVQCLGWMEPSSRVASVLAAALEDHTNSSQVRSAAARALGIGGYTHDQAAGALLRQIDVDPVAEVRRVAAESICKVGPRSTDLPKLRKLLSDTSPSVRGKLVRAIAIAGRKDGRGLGDLRSALEDESELVRDAAVRGLGSFGSSATSAIPLLVRIVLNAREPLDLRGEGALALGRISPNSSTVTSLMTEMAESESPRLRRSAVWALGRSSESSVLPAIIRRVRDAEWEVRLNAVESLSNFEDRMETVQALVVALQDQEPRVRIAAESFLIRAIDGNSKVAVLVGSILTKEEASGEEKTQLVELLGSAGESARPALPFLRSLVEDDAIEGRLREAAMKAIQRVDQR